LLDQLACNQLTEEALAGPQLNRAGVGLTCGHGVRRVVARRGEGPELSVGNA
jgi:hypothetical protein